MHVVYGVFAAVLFLGAVVSIPYSPLAAASAFFGWALYMMLWGILRTLEQIRDTVSQPIAITPRRPDPTPASPPAERREPLFRR